MILALAFYGLLTCLALWATWGARDLRWVGVMLALSFATSNLLWFFGSVESRPGVYTMLELFVMLAAYMAWEAEHRYGLIVLVGVTILSIAANIAFAATLVPTVGQIRTYEIITNICFATECLLATGMGVADGVRSGRFRRWLGFRRPRLKPDVARKEP